MTLVLNLVDKITCVYNLRFRYLKRLGKVLTNLGQLLVISLKAWEKSLAIVITSLTVEHQNVCVPSNQRLIQQKVGSANIRLSNTIPAGRYSGQGPVVKFHLASVFCLVSGRPVFKTWVVGLNLRPPRSGHCPECLEAGVGSIYHRKFTVTRTVPSGFQLAGFELENSRI